MRILRTEAGYSVSFDDRLELEALAMSTYELAQLSDFRSRRALQHISQTAIDASVRQTLESKPIEVSYVGSDAELVMDALQHLAFAHEISLAATVETARLLHRQSFRFRNSRPA